MSHRLYISRSTRDKRFADPLHDYLMRLGFKVWTDPNPRPGLDWRFEIDEAIRTSDAVIVVVTPNSAESVYVTYEWTLALAKNVRVIPVIFLPAPMHPRLETLDRFDVTSFREQAQFWDYFAREMRRIFAYQPGMIQAPLQPAFNTPAPVPAPSAPTVDRTVMPPASGYWLVMRRGPKPNMMWRFDGQIVTLGRDKTNDISIEDNGVSRFHCRFTQFPEGFAVEDNNSTNGIIVNGNRVQGIVPLFGGMTLQMGDNVVLTYEVVP
jgi:hypothetical protein